MKKKKKTPGAIRPWRQFIKDVRTKSRIIDLLLFARKMSTLAQTLPPCPCYYTVYFEKPGV